MNKRHDPTGAAEDRGYTLIEMLVAICLMGTIVLSIMGGMWAVVRASSQNDERAKVQAILGAAGDSLVNLQHWNCPEVNQAYVEYVQKPARNVGWDRSTVTISKYEYWNPESHSWDPTNTVQGSQCNPEAGLTPNKTMQRITVSATSPGGGYTNSIQIVKADIRPKELRDVTPVAP